MKVSIVLPVYNGSETLEECLNAIANIDYPKQDFELIVVNDGSKDRSNRIIGSFINKNREKLNVRYLDLSENIGRIKARLKGVEESRYENLLFVDHRCMVEQEILQEIKKKEYQPIIGNPYQDKKESIISSFFYVLRRMIYYPYWGEDFEDVYINRENFDKIPKGFCPFFCDKELLLRNIPERKGKNINDDTLIFSNILKEKNILKTSDCKAKYTERNIGENFAAHLFNRGPKFVHFYFTKGLKYRATIFLIALYPTLLGLPIFGVIALPEILYIFGGVVLLLSVVLTVRYKVAIIDVLIFFLLFPEILFIFSLGVWKGLFLNFFKKFD
jgi:glycosyltransferase involved in cell wall biosynthesis